MASAKAPTSEAVTVQRRGATVWVQGLACGALLTFATPTALLLGILLAPAILCILASPGAERGVFRAVASSCAAASLAPVWRLWMNGGHMDEVAAILASPSILCAAWGAGAAAWAMCQVLPVIIKTAWDIREANKAKTIEAELAQLNEEWGLKQTAEQTV